MADPITVSNFRDAYVNSLRADTNYVGVSSLKVGGTTQSFLYWANTIPVGATVISARLMLYNIGTWAGSVTLTAAPLAVAWSGSKVTYNRRPAIRTAGGTPTAVMTKVGALQLTLWDLDVTAIMQSIANGQPWYGIRLVANGTPVRSIYSSEHPRLEARPTLVIEWSDNPEEPEDLLPDDDRAVSIAKPKLQYTFVDVSGNTQIGAQQVQLSNDPTFATTVYDSLWVPTSVAEFDLETYAGNKLTGTFEADTEGWLGASNCNVARSTAQAASGAASLSMTSVAAGNMVAGSPTGIGNMIPTTPGLTYAAEIKSRAATTARNFQAIIYWYNEAGSYISPTLGTAVANTTGGWTTASVSGVAPAGALYRRIATQVLATGAANEVHYVDEVKTALGTKYWAGLADGGSIYWRVRTKDQVNLESVWSDIALFRRTTKGVFTVTALAGPDSNGNYYVEDNTPTIAWTLTGRPQQAYQVMISKASTPTKYIFNSGKITATDNQINVGSTKVLTSQTELYRLRVVVWDTTDRVATNGDPLYYEYIQDFMYKPSATVTPPTDVSVVWPRPWPWVDIAFSRTSPPDTFNILRDGEVIETNIDPADVLVLGNNYTYRDKTASPRVPHTWQVSANVNGKDSVPSTGDIETISPGFTWLMEPDGGRPVAIVKSADKPSPVVEASSMSFQEVHQPVGGTSPVLITQYISGFEGRVEGVLADDIVDGLTAQKMRDRFKYWKRNPGTELILFMVDEAILITPYNMTYRPRARGGGVILYDISFDFFQMDN